MKLEEMVGKRMTEAQFDEAAGEKDACYRKVKARYDVWPSAYASGALVKCRKVGAANWGNKSKKESVNESLLKQIKQAEKIAKSMSGNMTGAVKGIEKIRRGLSRHKRVRVALKKYNESVTEGQKREASNIMRKYDLAFLKFSREIRDVIKSVDRSTGSKVDGKIIEKAYEKGLIPLNKIMIEWDRGQQENPGLNEAYDIWMEDGSFGGTFTGLVEAEYQGRKVKLGKPMQGDSKKFKVYVKNPKGNVVKVNFGQGGDAKGGTMKIRKSNPGARKSFRARHNCDSPGPKHKARYWSCRKW